MSEYAYFYNSENGDRVYDADSFSNWLKKFFTTGVFEGDCQVTALGSMVVNLAPGYANIMGKVKELENQTFTLEPADGSYPRIDTIVIERNDTDRDITAKVVTGQLNGNTPAPTPRVWENGVYQLIVAEVYVAAGATEVTQANITDKRSDPDVCGIVAGTVTEMDFSQFTAQFEAYFAEFQASNLDEFDEWFQHMKDQLDTDAAGHLQNEIDAINAKIPSGASSSNKLATESEITEINDNLTSKTNFIDYSNVLKTLDYQHTSWIASEDCFINFIRVSQTSDTSIKINNIECGTVSNITNVYVTTFMGYIKKDTTITINYGNAIIWGLTN